MIRRRLPDLAIIALLFLLPLIVFWQQTLGGRTLIPAENLYQYEPYATYREQVNAPAQPYNPLVSDLVLQNFQWKSFIRQSLAEGEIPLWSPHQLGGVPFLAAGQQSTLYPFSLIYYVLPLPLAYGWFTVVQLWLAGVFMYALLRGLDVSRPGAALAGVVYQLSGFFIISAVFPMMIAAAAWIPLTLLMTEFIIRQRPALRGQPATIPWVVIGGIGLGCNILAGHVEITYYLLIITAFYAAARLLGLAWVAPFASLSLRFKHLIGRGLWLVAMVGLGLALGAAQFIPLFEFASLNYRDGRNPLAQILEWAHKPRDVIQYLLPNFYGNPTHHTYFDLFTMQTVTELSNARGEGIRAIDWGIKNYVEGALYVGILPLLLAAYGLIHGWMHRRDSDKNLSPQPPLRSRRDGVEVSEAGAMSRLAPRHPPLIFLLLTLIALTVMFGLPTYALLYYLFPGINQLHSPFRWVLAVTLGIAALSGFGLDALLRGGRSRLARGFAFGSWAAGGLILLGLIGAWLAFPTLEPLFQRIVDQMALAANAFRDGRMFFSYQFPNLLILSVMLIGSGVVFWLGSRRRSIVDSRQKEAVSHQPSVGDAADYPSTHPSSLVPRYSLPSTFHLALFTIPLVALDLMLASYSFNPVSDPALLDFRPPAIEWLQAQPGAWRYITIDEPSLGERGKILNANMTWRYGLDDARGYESIIPKQYVEFMSQLAPQVQLDFNRVAPLYPDYQYQAMGMDFRLTDALTSPLLGLLNVRYVVSSKQFTLPDALIISPEPRRLLPLWKLAYEDEAVRIWEQNPWPRAYVAQPFDDQPPGLELNWGVGFEVAIDSDSGREKILHANISAVPSWLVVSETHLPGWRAFVRPRGGDDSLEKPLETQMVLSNFIGINVSRPLVQPLYTGMTLPEAQQIALDNGQITVRLVYSPASFQIGLFASFIGGILLIFLMGIYLWRLFIGAGDGSGVQVVARNSLAPIILNLFNRGIDFGFAFIMLRILGPEGNGIYAYAGFIFMWFDIFTNFGLNLFLIREVARDRGSARRILLNTSALRLLLIGVGVLLLIGFLFVRQNAGGSILTAEGILAIGLLYVGLLPNSLSTGLSALFQAFQKAEVPAAIATLATISKVSLGILALLLGYGVIGLAAASIVTNLLTLAVMAWAARPLLVESSSAGQRVEPALMRQMAGEGWPLMLNHFLATIFFQIDVVIIQYFHGDRMVGLYNVAYKWLNALNVIPAFLTMALLPSMSRQAHEDRAALKRNYQMAIKLLFSTALPIAVIFTFIAYFLTEALGGREFIPDGAIATQLMIWSIPIGWMNSLTQYVLIALDMQRRITTAFVVAVSFNIISNWLLIPRYGYQAAALTTIASELMLLIPFALLLRGALGPLNWFNLLWKPLAAGAVMFITLGLLYPAQPLLALLLAVTLYGGLLLGLRVLDTDEMARLLPLLPGRVRQMSLVRRYTASVG